MSAFDQRVSQWLNTASITPKNKITLLNRMSVGIANYRSVDIEALQITPTRHHVETRIDYAFQDQIAKALRRIQGGDVGTAELPLFSQDGAAANTPRFGQPRTPRGPGGGVSTPRASAEPSTVAAPVAEPAAFAHDKDERRASIAQFRFGEALEDEPFSSSGNAAAADEDHAQMDGGTMDQEESEHRKRATMKRQSRHAISAEPIDAETVKTAVVGSVPKSSEIASRVILTLEGHNLFSHLDDSDIAKVADVMQLRSYKRGEKIVVKGKPNDTFFVVVVGSCTNSESKEGRVNVGGYFGDIHLMYDTPCEETIESAVQMTQCCSIDRKTYQIITSRASTEKRLRYEGFLSNVKFLQGLTAQEKLQLADALKIGKYKKGDKVIKYGEEGHWFNIIVEGSVDVIGRDSNGHEVNVCSFGVGDCVGELEFLFKHKTVADVVAATPVVRTAKMTAKHFEKVIGPAKEVLERQAQSDDVYSYYRQTRKQSTSS